MAVLNVSIVTYRTPADEMRRCLASLRSDAVRMIYVIDNASDPEMERLCRGLARVTYMAGDNVGYGAGHNKALRISLADMSVRYHLVLNSDVSFSPEILPAMIDEMDRRPDVGQLHPLVLNPDGSCQYTVRRLPTPLDVFGRRFLPPGMMRKRNERYMLCHRPLDRELDVAYHQGSFMLLRLDALREVGLFDERFFMYPEDIDLTRRMHRRYKTLYWPGATVVHDHRAASYRSLRMTVIHAVNLARYFFKWGWWFDPERRAVNRTVEADIGAMNKKYVI